MGTNYYWIVTKDAEVHLANGAVLSFPVDMDNPKIHIGKTSGAGRYCKRCDRPLMTNPKRVHYGDGRPLARCPSCNRDEGVCDYVCSFSWAQEEGPVRTFCKMWHSSGVIIKDEYGTPYTGKMFLDLIDSIPPCYNFTDSIGTYFS